MQQDQLRRGLLAVLVLAVTLDCAQTGHAQEATLSETATTPAAAPAAFPTDQLNPPSPFEGASMEDLLLEKGLITMDDWIRIKAEEEQRRNEQSVVAEFTASPSWYTRLRMYGYGMFRYSRLGQPNGKLTSFVDRSIGDNQGISMRRLRWVVTGQVSEHVGIFFQPDLASNLAGNTHVVTMRDAWGEWYFDKDKEYRVRLGLQRVPCSWDNWQASRQRMAFERADSTNSCAPSERDMGVSFMWSPKIAQTRFKRMLDYMYGPGDYGVINITVDNGQGLNRAEANDDKRVGLRLAWPFELSGGRLMEAGLNMNRQQFVVSPGTPVAGTSLWSRLPAGHASGNYLDERLNLYVYYPPQPWGFIAEYVTGRGPKRGSDGVIRENHLYGWYVQGHYQWKYSDIDLANFYARYQEYYGGVKFLTGAPDGRMKDLELGVAWEPDPQWKITVAYTFTERLNSDTTTPGTVTLPGQQLEAYGNLIRLQAVWFWN
jgi:hypothetical protein